MTHPRALEVLRAEAALLEAEVALLAAEREAGAHVEGKRRPFEHELRAGVRFAELDRDVVDTTGAVTRRATAVREQLLDDLAELTTAAVDDSPLDAVARVRALADPTSTAALPNARAAVDLVAADVELELTRLAERSSAELLDEARRQGLTDLPRVELDADDRRAIRAAARRVAEQPVTAGLAVAVEAAERLAPGAQDGAEVLFGALEAVEDASPAGLEDVARQASSSAQGIGRTRAARLAPRPRQAYASELLDGNTCGPCGDVDGRLYDTLEHALEDYPGAGGFVFCAGGARCRGTLVYVWDTEQAPTIGPDGPPQGPSDPPGGPDGPVRPLPPDDRTSFPRPYVPPAPPPLPAAPLPPQTPPAIDPAGVARTPDPELEQLGDAAVEAGLRDALRTGDQAAAVRHADELDRRADLGAAWRDPDLEEEWDVGPDLTPEEELAQAARIAAGMEEAVPELAQLDGVTAGGRRIDRVRADFEVEQYRRMMAAENEGAEGIRADRRAEFDRKYGSGPGAGMELLWFGPAHRAYYYASEELRNYWQQHGRGSFAEYAVAAGIRDSKTLARAKAAQAADADAAARAESAGTERDAERRRQAAADRRKRRATGPGAELERARRRAEREQRRAAKAVRDLERQGVRVENLDPPAGA